MLVDSNGLKFIEANEGFCATPKPDNKGLQWGYGHDQQPGEDPPVSITPEQAEALLVEDLVTRFEPAVQHLIPSSATQNQINACIDFCYNEGPRNFATLLSHGWDQVPLQMPRWCWAEVDGIMQELPGLQSRRAKEVTLFNTL